MTHAGNKLRIAITGGTGFVGSALARALRAGGHEIVLISRRAGIDLDDLPALSRTMHRCDAVAHLAGINRETGAQTYNRVHINGTANVIAAAKAAAVRRIVMLSFLRARPDCGSPYHESKWQAEQLLRASGIDYTIVKSGVVYGRGDHLLDHLSHSLFTIPLFATVGFRQPPLRPVAVQDVARILPAALTTERLRNKTIALVGPQTLTMRDVVRRVAAAIDRRVWVFPLPVAFHRLLARAMELTMHVPLVALAQVRILQEGLADPFPSCDPLPRDLSPRRTFTVENIRRELPPPGPFRCSDFRCCVSTSI
jgi:uncharacterized protein YbjT (DUF2867 family)